MEHRDIRQLFKKYTEGTITGSELHTLHEHFGTALHEAELKELMLAYFAENDGEDINDQDAWEIASEARPSVLEYARTVKNGRVVPWKWIIAAAVLLATISLSLWIYRNENDINTDNKFTHSLGNDVLPGTNRATLILSNGSTIQLSETENGIIVGDSITYDGGETITSFAHAEYVTLSTPRAGQYQITLSDGTKVWLNAESSLEYPTAFTGKERKVTLSGEAYFEVAKDKSLPFIVESGEQVLTVLGTSFNINSYDSNVITTLVNGKVNLANKGSAQANPLLPGQQAVLSNGNFAIRAVDINDYVAWKEGFIIINNATIGDVVEQVERWYDVQFDLRSRPDITAYVALNRSSNLSEVLDALEINYGIKFKIEGRQVIEIE